MPNQLGNFAGEFLKAFSGSRVQKQERDKQDKQNKLILKLMEEQLSDKTAQREALELVTRRMTGQGDPVPQFADAPGGLGLEKTGATPADIRGPGMSLPEMLADRQLQGPLMRSGQLPQIQEMAGAQSRSDLAGAAESSGMPIQQFLQTPEGGAMALRSGLTPAQFMTQQSGTDVPSFIAEMQAVGIEPESAEGREMFIKRYADTDDTLYKQIQAQFQLVQLDNARRERETSITDATREQRELRSAIHNTFRKAEELATLNDRLEGTALQTGQPFGKLYRNVIAGGAPFVESLGFDTGDAAQMVSDFDVFNKLANDVVIDMVSRLEGSGITNFQLQSLQSAFAGIGTSPGANRMVLSELLQATLDASDINEVDVPNREGVESLITKLRSTGPTAQPVAFDVRTAAGDVASMTLQQIQSIDPQEVATWGEEQKAALASRIGEMRAIFGSAASEVGAAGRRGLGAASEASRQGLGAASEQFRETSGQLMQLRGPAEEQLREFQAQLGAVSGRAAGAASNVASMTLQQIRSIDTEEIATWTAEQRAALDKRLQELGF